MKNAGAKLNFINTDRHIIIRKDFFNAQSQMNK